MGGHVLSAPAGGGLPGPPPCCTVGREGLTAPPRKEQNDMITVKNRQIDWHTGLTIPKLLETLGYKSRLVMVRVDGQVIRKQGRDGFRIPDGAQVEIRPLMAGG